MRIILVAIVVILGKFVKSSIDEDDYDEAAKCGFYADRYYKPHYPYDGEPYIGQFPWFGVVYHRSLNSTWKFACGGTLISDKYVITARKCTLNGNGTMMESDDIVVRMGTHEDEHDKPVINMDFSWSMLRDYQMSDKKWHDSSTNLSKSTVTKLALEKNVDIGNAQYRHVSKILQPVEYDKTSKNELIILELSEKVEYNRYVQRICIQTKDRLVRPTTVFGWSTADGVDTHLKEFKRKTTKCPYKHIKTTTYYNQTEICSKDPGSIGIINYRYFVSWFIIGLIDCTSPPFVPCEREPNLKTVAMIQFNAYIPWIINITNLTYLKREKLDLHLERFNKKENSQSFKFQCGQRPVNNTEKDINEYEIDSYPGQWPWYGTVYHRRQSHALRFACGGTLISEKHVLTVRVCVTNETGDLLKNEDVFVRFGTHSQSFYNFGFAQHRAVTKIHEPATFDENSANKIVILEVKEGIKLNDYVQPVCIKPQFFALLSNIFIGWRAAGEIGKLEQFRKKRCTNLVNRWYYNQTDICNKDRGSIAIYLHYDEWKIDGFIGCTELQSDPCNITFLPNSSIPISETTYGEKLLKLIEIKDYAPWIIHVTKLDYLQKITKGQKFDRSKKYPNLLPQLSCGQSFTTHNFSDPHTQLYEHPWMARIGWKESNDTWVNKHTGTLISHRYVLTDTYLAKEYAESNYRLFVRLGEHDYLRDPDCDENGCAPPVRDFEVESFIVHQDYDVGSTTFSQYIALIRTKKDVFFEDHIFPVCLPVQPELRKLNISTFALVNWNIFDIQSSTLQQSKVRNIYETDVFDYFWTDDVPFSTICLNSDGSTVGTYVDFNRARRFVQIGIQSCQEFPNGLLYNINVVFFMDWIVANMRE